MLRRTLVTACLVAGLVTTSLGTAHGATVSPDTWAPKFCKALKSWQSTLATQGEAATSAISAGPAT
jgi:hypothetical protein